MRWPLLQGDKGMCRHTTRMQNAFCALKSTDSDNDNVSMANTVATQVAALTYQSQLTQSPPPPKHNAKKCNLPNWLQLKKHNTPRYIRSSKD